MTIQLNTIIDRPITDARHFTSTLLAESNVQHAWSLIQSKAYSDPTSSVGGLKLPSRLPGGVPLKSWSPSPAHLWDTRGGYEVSAYPANGVGIAGESAWTAEITNPGPVFSIVAVSKQPTGFVELAGFDYADLNAHLIPHKNQRSVNVNATTYDMGAAAPLDSWFTSAWVFDFTNSIVASSINGDAFGEMPVPDLIPRADATIHLAVGRGYAVTGNNQNYDNGSISDFIILSGDIRNNPGFLAQIETYNATGYGA